MEAYEAYLAGIVSILGGYITSRIANWKVKGFFQHIGAFLVLAIIAGTLTYAVRWAVQPSRPSEYEGYWLEKYKDGNNDVYAIAKTQYNNVTRYLEFSGTSYDKSLSVVGRWHSVQAHFEKGQYDYLFEGESFNPDPTKRGLRKGVGGIFFNTNAHGKGHFLSMKDDREPRPLELFKILDEDAARLAGQAPTELVKRLFADDGYFARVTAVR